jgi:hypothetical protein
VDDWQASRVTRRSLPQIAQSGSDRLVRDCSLFVESRHLPRVHQKGYARPAPSPLDALAAGTNCDGAPAGVREADFRASPSFRSEVVEKLQRTVSLRRF